MKTVKLITLKDLGSLIPNFGIVELKDVGKKLYTVESAEVLFPASKNYEEVA